MKKDEEEKLILSKTIENLFYEKTNNKYINKIKKLFIYVSGKYENYIAKIPLIQYNIKN